MKENIWHPDGSRKILDEIEAAGPVHGWFIYHSSFLDTATKGTIFYLPREEEEEEEEELRYSSESGLWVWFLKRRLWVWFLRRL
jgi:hypothetical protein